MKPKQLRIFQTTRGYQISESSEKKLSPAMEDYLEMTARLCSESGCTRIGVLSAALNVKPSSASKMVVKLKELGYLTFEKSTSIILTDKGREKSGFLLFRHATIEQFLVKIGSPDALKEAELIEHHLSAETVYAIKKLLSVLSDSS